MAWSQWDNVLKIKNLKSPFPWAHRVPSFPCLPCVPCVACPQSSVSPLPLSASSTYYVIDSQIKKYLIVVFHCWWLFPGWNKFSLDWPCLLFSQSDSQTTKNTAELSSLFVVCFVSFILGSRFLIWRRALPTIQQKKEYSRTCLFLLEFKTHIAFSRNHTTASEE